ncbi:hypothetical protein PAXRUDRAFT_829815 [Paxillus rubicundulus Ve08.2h10]|uniref:Uncharacterized protein n=1 Tax=Paxillus rubicundulus Ve08.2h10 TaxID=930991 RepID=A0A0D0DM35_9AGAM|nr:hypothetical protein PAXRUDRAFT_829815 [Paxillus rubicundulus Ve08.2h10]
MEHAHLRSLCSTFNAQPASHIARRKAVPTTVSFHLQRCQSSDHRRTKHHSSTELDQSLLVVTSGRLVHASNSDVSQFAETKRVDCCGSGVVPGALSASGTC